MPCRTLGWADIANVNFFERITNFAVHEALAPALPRCHLVASIASELLTRVVGAAVDASAMMLGGS